MAGLINLILGQTLGRDFQRLRGTRAHDLHQLWGNTGGLCKGFLYLFGGQIPSWHVELRASLKVQREIEATKCNSQDGGDEQHTGDGVPGLGPTNEVKSTAVYVKTVKAGNLAVSSFDSHDYFSSSVAVATGFLAGLA